MRLLTTIFPYFISKNKEIFLLLGKNHKLKVLNGFGGKVEPGEDVTESAIRELGEELNIVPSSARLEFIGRVLDGEKKISFFVYELSDKSIPNFNIEEIYFVDWFALKDRDSFIDEMLSGDSLILEHIENLLGGKRLETFEIDKSGDEKLKEQTKNIYQP